MTKEVTPVNDSVNHPSHYTGHPSGVECIQITEHMLFNIGNAFKYIWRADLKENPKEDLEKAIWYLQRELLRREKLTATKAKTETQAEKAVSYNI